MEIWETLGFGIQALSLRSAATDPPEKILQVQRERLEELVNHARDHSVFYRKRLEGLPQDGFDLQDIPPVTKAEIMEHFDEVLTVDDVRRADVEAFFKDPKNLGSYFRDTYLLSHTSGSQGQPLLIVQPKENLGLMFAMQASRGNHESLSLTQVVKRFASPARLAAVTLKRGFYPSAVAFEYMPEGARHYIETIQISSTDEDLIQKLAEFRPTHLTAYASVLHVLARQIESGRLSLQPELQQVVNISERLIPQARAHYQEVFQVPILDDYAMGECLFLSNGCTKSPGMHVNADWAILEVVDENGAPVPDGTKGAKVLVTNLANRVQPFIRYEVGDVVTMAETGCDCGSNLPLIGAIEGRDSDVFWLKDSKGDWESLSPAALQVAMTNLTAVREYQMLQEEEGRIKILVEPINGQEVNLEEAQRTIDTHLEEYQLEDRLRVSIELVEELLAEEGRKFSRVVSRVGPD